MESRIFCAYNETSKCFLSTRVTVVDAALEPLRVLRVLMEGLRSDSSGGIWLIHFKGVPVARAVSPFDLIYLDMDFRVVHGVEVSADSNFEPFKGQPWSALVLPPSTITAAKTRQGHQINFREILDPASRAPDAVSPSPVPDGLASVAETPAGQGGQPGGLLSAFAGLAVQNPSPAGTQAAMQASQPSQSAAPERAIGAPSVTSGPLTRSAQTWQPSRPGLERAPIANIPSRVVPASVPKSIQVPPELGPSARSANAALSGRLLRSAPSHPESAAAAQPMLPEVAEPAEAAPARAPESQTVHGTVIPFPTASAPAEAPQTESHPQEPSALPGMSPPFRWDELKAPPTIEIVEPQQAAPAPSMDSQQGSEEQTKESDLRNTRIEQALAPKSKTKRDLPWDVRLLYWVFPEFDPEQEMDFRIPRADFLNEAKSGPGAPSRKLQFLSWLYPDLHLERVEKTRREARAAPRLPNPGLVAYFFTGGSPRPHEVKNISVTGFYMYTNERWLPGTIIRVTLQIVGTSGENPHDTITVHSRVVRWGIDGGGFEFVLPGFIDQ
jgi:hypothetical protein